MLFCLPIRELIAFLMNSLFLVICLNAIVTHIPPPKPLKSTIQEGEKPPKGMAGSDGKSGEERRKTSKEGGRKGKERACSSTTNPFCWKVKAEPP